MNLPSATIHRVTPETEAVLQRLKPGQRIRVTQTVRVGRRQWQAAVEGMFREVRPLVTGLSYHRRVEDDIVIPTVHFTKDNGELSSIALDEHTRIEILGG